MKYITFVLLTAAERLASTAPQDRPPGLPQVPVPADNPPAAVKIALGRQLSDDTRVSRTLEIGCFTSHAGAKAYTNKPRFSEGDEKCTGMRNVPAVINGAINHIRIWYGREPGPEGLSKRPMVNTIEHGLYDHAVVPECVGADDDDVAAFKAVFGVNKGQIAIDQVVKPIAALGQWRKVASCAPTQASHDIDWHHAICPSGTV